MGSRSKDGDSNLDESLGGTRISGNLPELSKSPLIPEHSLLVRPFFHKDFLRDFIWGR